jgi:hypothetical protein
MFLLRIFMREKIRNKNHESYFTMAYSKIIREIFPQEAKGLDSPTKANARMVRWLKHLKVAISTREGMPSE